MIFICNYDPFGKNRCIYTFENTCKEVPGLSFADNTYKVVVNTRGTEGEISEALREVIRYLDKGIVTGEYSHSLQNAVDDIKRSEARREEYMIMMVREMEIRDEGIEIGEQRGIEIGKQRGIEIGEQKGRQEGTERLGALITRLIALNRSDDVLRAASDAAYRDKLFEEFQIP